MTPDEVRRTMLRPDLGPFYPPARAIYRGPDVLLGDGSQVLHSGDEVEVFGEHGDVTTFWVRREVNGKLGTTTVRARCLHPAGKPPSQQGYRLVNHPTGQTELQVTDWQGTELWVGGSGNTGATAQVRVGPRGPDRAVHLDRDAAIAVRDMLTRLIEGTAR